MLTIGSLFSGIGGLELGLERAELGPVIWQCEIDPFCRSVLEKHWPSVERFQDVTRLSNPPHVDLICGGFPCQDISSAGKGAGLAGERSGLWYQFARVVQEAEPEWVIVENVTSGATVWVDEIRRGLGELGYGSLPVPLSAQDVGAPHRRARVFVVAHAGYIERRLQPEPQGQKQAEEALQSPRHGETGDAANTNQAGPQRPVWQERESTERPWSADTMPEPALCRVDDGPDAWLHRPARLRALGNAVVPQCAEVIGWVIRELLADNSQSPPARGK